MNGKELLKKYNDQTLDNVETLCDTGHDNSHDDSGSGDAGYHNDSHDNTPSK